MRVEHSDGPLPDVISIRRPALVRDVSIRVPGSKSITNRALICAALAAGSSKLTGVLLAEDTRAMLDSVAELGAGIAVDEANVSVRVTGTDPRVSRRPVHVKARQSGTTSRFMLPVVALGQGPKLVDGGSQLRTRPFGPLLEAVRGLGASVEELGQAGCLPVAVTGPLTGGRVRLSGHLSSQFLSGLLMAGPLMRDGLDVELTSPLVSAPTSS
jgi:3-phosphoshikimate 1-carboxyvinyltransferase